jgi:hypothetical protein
MSQANKEYFEDWQRELSRDPGYINWLDAMSEAATRGNNMDMNNVFPSKYLKAADLQGHKVKLTIARVVMEDIGTDTKPVMYFNDKEKGVVLNKTKAGVLSGSFSPESDGWIGKEIALYPTKVNFQGQMVDSIGIEVVVSEFSDMEEPPF